METCDRRCDPNLDPEHREFLYRGWKDSLIYMRAIDETSKPASTEWDQEGPMVTVKRDWFAYKKEIFGAQKNRDILVHNA